MTPTMELTSTFGLIRLPNTVSVQPFEGFELIMPRETVEVTVTFQSQMPKNHKFTIQVVTPQGQKVSIPCVGTVIPPSELSGTTVEFQATPLDLEIEASRPSRRANTAKRQPPRFHYVQASRATPAIREAPKGGLAADQRENHCEGRKDEAHKVPSKGHQQNRHRHVGNSITRGNQQGIRRLPI
jgi:hypothetical protein